MALLLGKVDNIEQKASGCEESPGDAVEFPGGFILERFLNECRSDAQTVLDSIEYQREQDFADIGQPALQAESPKVAPKVESDSTTPLKSPTILFRNSLGHVREIALENCRTWAVREPSQLPREAVYQTVQN